MAARAAEDEQRGRDGTPAYRRIGHKGADAIVTGNTAESFDAAVEEGVDMIELDVLRSKEGRLIVAHDPHDALIRKPMELAEALDLFLEPPLDEVEFESLIKLRKLEPDLRLGWTYPKTRRDWTQYGWAGPALRAGLSAMRRRFPGILEKKGPSLGVNAG